jgi:hypothetical protein
VGDDEFRGRPVYFPRTALEHVLDRGGGAWVDDVRTAKVETLDELLAGAMRDAVKTVGGRPWGELHVTEIAHPLGVVSALRRSTAAHHYGRSRRPYWIAFVASLLGGAAFWSVLAFNVAIPITRNHQEAEITTALENILIDDSLIAEKLGNVSSVSCRAETDRESKGLRTYLEKGGFLIVDDFMRREWYNFAEQIRRVLPNGHIDRLDVSHKIFHSFFDLETLDMTYPHDRSLKAEFLGIHENNDPSRRLMVVINYNNDIGDYMEHSGRSWYSVAPTNEAFKLGINYVLYGLTH